MRKDAHRTYIQKQEDVHYILYLQIKVTQQFNTTAVSIRPSPPNGYFLRRQAHRGKILYEPSHEDP